jgi:hypothetical protein
MRENGVPGDRHYKTTRDKKGWEEEKTGFVQDLGVLRGFRAGLTQNYAHSTFFVPRCNRLQWGLIGEKRPNNRLSERQSGLEKMLNGA